MAGDMVSKLTPEKEKEILSELLYDAEKELSELVKKVKQVFEIDESGKPIWKINFHESTILEKIYLVLSAAFFARELGKLKVSAFSVSELGKEIGVPMTALSGPLKKMNEMGHIKKSGRKYEITTYGIEWIINRKVTPERAIEPTEIVEKPILREEIPLEIPHIVEGRSCRETIKNLLSKPWGRTPKTAKEIKEALEMNAIHYSDNTLLPALTFLTKKGVLRRLPKGEIYAYVLSKRQVS
jgi:DNA-binding Lrp family transcriptional regulator